MVCGPGLSFVTEILENNPDHNWQQQNFALRPRQACTVTLHATEQSDRAPEPLGFAVFVHAGPSVELGALCARARTRGARRRARPSAARHAWLLPTRPEPGARVRAAAPPQAVLQHRCVPPMTTLGHRHSFQGENISYVVYGEISIQSAVIYNRLLIVTKD